MGSVWEVCFAVYWVGRSWRLIQRPGFPPSEGALAQVETKKSEDDEVAAAEAL